MRRTNVLCRRISLTLLGILIGLALCEVFVRAFVNVRNVGPSFSVYDPFYGKVLKKNFSASRFSPEFTMRFTTNARGFRGPPMASTSVRPILFLGDSFTLGYGVTDGREFPDLVRKALNAKRPDTVPVINAGIGDNATGMWVKFLRAEGEALNPGLVVLQVHATDYFDNIRHNVYRMTSDGALHEQPVAPPGFKRKVQTVIEAVPGLMYCHLMGLVKQSLTGVAGIPSDEVNDVEDPLLLRLLEEVVNLCDEHQCPVLGVLADLPEARLAALKALFDAHGAPTVVIPTKDDRPDLYFKVDGHWNESGQRYVADRVLEAIEKFNLKYW